ncbi:2'-5' RNA ligase family protein [Halorientalis sp.]|jgi:2'-5' RNA ligase|uniref:2'-5' RNA ligase family protein n=1 Tax=Halorientalis sp. TaxID=1931229 RepID=UPI0026051644|nr:2'-5' RNA ligase family protein [Halorientalis sp.]
MHDEDMASEASEFWARRREFDSSPGGDGSGDVGRQLVLLADVVDDAVRPAHDRIAGELDDFDCLTPSPFETLHLTIKLFNVPAEATDVDDPAVNRIGEAISGVVEDTSPFEVTFTRFNLFPDVVYAEVDAAGRLDAMNRRLCAQPEIAELDRDAEGFIPHLTLGYFTNSTDYHALVTSLETDREVPLPGLTVDELALVAYEVGSGWPSTYDRLETYEL